MSNEPSDDELLAQRIDALTRTHQKQEATKAEIEQVAREPHAAQLSALQNQVESLAAALTKKAQQLRENEEQIEAFKERRSFAAWARARDAFVIAVLGPATLAAIIQGHWVATLPAVSALACGMIARRLSRLRLTR